jgi:F-box domain.
MRWIFVFIAYSKRTRASVTITENHRPKWFLFGCDDMRMLNCAAQPNRKSLLLTQNHHLDACLMATLIDLPPELLLQVTHHLDDESLLNLAATSTTLNSLSISIYFDRHEIDNPSSGHLSLYPWRTTAHTLRAIRSSLQAHCLTSLTIQLNLQASFTQFYSDMHAIRVIVEHTRKLHYFSLGGGDLWHWWLPSSPEIPSTFRPEDLLVLYSSLYEAVGRSACKDVTMHGLPRFLCYLLTRRSPTTSSWSSERTNLEIEGASKSSSLVYVSGLKEEKRQR